MKYTFGFIGCGNMGGALAAAVAKKNPSSEIAVADFMPEKVQSLVSLYGVNASSTKEIAATCKYIFLGVKPQMIASMFDEIKDILAKRSDVFVLVSMAAGISVSGIRQLSGGDYPVIRIMPNTPAAIGKGMILYTANNNVSILDLSHFVEAMSGAGKLDKIEESKIDAASAVSGCGPAYVYMMIEALADGAVECGLTRDKAVLYAAQTLLGAAEMVIETGRHPGELKDAVCSPGGTTIAGVHALEEHGFRAAAIDAVCAAYKKTLELKK